jgi:hypothetical protein
MLRAWYLYGPKLMHRMYRAWRLIFQDDPVREPIAFHVIEDGKLIIRGAMSALSLEDGLYLDCAPDWEHPVLDDDVLTITQVYSATPNGDTLEVE